MDTHSGVPSERSAIPQGNAKLCLNADQAPPSAEALVKTCQTKHNTRVQLTRMKCSQMWRDKEELTRFLCGISSGRESELPSLMREFTR
ncbi:hypothetical protein ZHAS_00014224 [Anopheles sinensis]|uniref:Uncharacterized protein n=1 Tax=Anopheles sinensis TaxID=74873 RepID=A0A084W7M4_ANOSI|nr:hypothetical protein ZHAS_00014224 [Anopheles sinensis]